MNYIFTFGMGHMDANGNSLGNSYVVIPGRTEDEARAIIAILRGRKWSHQYDSESLAGVARFNLTRVSIDVLYLPEHEAPRGFESVLFRTEDVNDVA